MSAASVIIETVARRASRLPLIVATLAGLAVTAAVAFAAITVIPQIIRASSTEIAATDTTIALRGDGVTATVPVDAGWSYVSDSAGDVHTTLTSPDGSFELDLTAAHGVDPEQAARDLVDGTVAPFDREPIGAATVVHARVVGEDAIVGAVVDGAAAVVFLARPGTAYEAELAPLLSRIEVAP